MLVTGPLDTAGKDMETLRRSRGLFGFEVLGLLEPEYVGP